MRTQMNKFVLTFLVHQLLVTTSGATSAFSGILQQRLKLIKRAENEYRFTDNNEISSRKRRADTFQPAVITGPRIKPPTPPKMQIATKTTKKTVPTTEKPKFTSPSSNKQDGKQKFLDDTHDIILKNEKNGVKGKKFGYAAPNLGHTEATFPDGVKVGEYFWDGPDGYRRIVTYFADENGFRSRTRQIKLKPTEAPPVVSNLDTKNESPGQKKRGATNEPLQNNNSENKRPARQFEGIPINTPGGVIAGEGPFINNKDLNGLVLKNCYPYTFDYNVETHWHNEEGFTDCSKKGQYGVFEEDGGKRVIDYTADSKGFRPKVKWFSSK